MTENNTVLIVEDEMIAAEYLKALLEEGDYNVLGICDKGTDAIRKAKELKPQLILMDIILKGNLSGCEAALEISRSVDSEIIFITAHSNDEMINYAAYSRAAGYLTKPYSEKQIFATMALALSNPKNKKRPVQTGECDKKIIQLIDGYRYDCTLKRLFKGENEIELSKKALKLVEILSKNVNTTISPEQISQYVYEKEMCEKTLRSLIYRIRKKVGTKLIRNASGSGYKIMGKCKNR